MNGRRLAALVLFDIVAILLVAGLVALSAWQMQRRVWKLDLIARVEARVHAQPAPPPPRERWPGLSPAADEYRRVAVTGRWLQSRAALVLATTELGGGYWVMSPLSLNDGSTVLINRGFVPTDKRDPATWQALGTGSETVTGLLRLSEPRGGVLRANDPGADRWYSRDVAEIAASRGLSDVAPYFIDLERGAGREGLPVPGLTVIAFANNHLVYALTWAALALMAAAAAIFVHLEFWRSRRLRPGDDATDSWANP